MKTVMGLLVVNYYGTVFNRIARIRAGFSLRRQ